MACLILAALESNPESNNHFPLGVEAGETQDFATGPRPHLFRQSRSAESEARAQHRGPWSAAQEPVPPWEYRRAGKKANLTRSSPLRFHARFWFHTRRALRIALLFALNQSKNPFIKHADLVCDGYQLLVLARKLGLPNMRRQLVPAASLTQLVQGLSKSLSVAFKESFFALESC
jgi:hypothetical protein